MGNTTEQSCISSSAFYAEPVKLEFSRVEPIDLEAFSAVIQGVSRWFLEHGKPMWPLETLTPEALLRSYPDGELWIGRIFGEAVACFVLVEDDPLFWPDAPSGTFLFVHKIAVDRGFTGRGFGAQILDFAGARAIAKGKRFFRLDTDASRTAVCAIYERYGSARVGTVFAHGFDCALFEMTL